MKRLIVIIFIISMNLVFSQNYFNVDGYVTIEKKNNHSGTEIKFEMITPDTATYFATSDSMGYYKQKVIEGIYKVTFNNKGFDTQVLNNIQIFKNVTLNTIVLHKVDISGSISGIISKGSYVLQDSCFIEKNKTLIIEPGVHLKFKSNSKLMVFGSIIAKGLAKDSIYFTELDSGNGWKGVHLENKDTISVFDFCSFTKSRNSALTINNSYANIYNSIFEDNSTNENITVPGIDSKYSDLHIKKCIFRNNVELGLLQGCAIKFEGGNDTVELCSFRNNSCNQWGSAINIDGSNVIVNNCEFLNNRAKYNASAIYIDDNIGTTDIINCTFSNNYVSNPTFSYNKNCVTVFGKARIFNCLFYNHNTPNIYYDYEKADLTIKNSCFYLQSGFSKTAIFKGSNQWLGQIVKKNLSNIDCDVYGNIFDNPDLLYASNGDLKLSNYSPCIDAGNNDFNKSEFDMADNPRIYSPRSDSVGVIDIGCYEFNGQFINDVTELPFNNFEITPNPATYNISISIINRRVNPTVEKVEIYDILGVLYTPPNTILIEGEQLRLDVSGLVPGVYFVKIGDRVQRFVKM